MAREHRDDDGADATGGDPAGGAGGPVLDGVALPAIPAPGGLAPRGHPPQGLTPAGSAESAPFASFAPEGFRNPADDVLTEEAARLVAAAPAANTRRAYDRAWKTYLTWCAGSGRTPLPASAATLASFVAHLAGRGLAPASVEQALACVLSAHGRAGLARPHTTAARDVLRAHRRAWAGAGNTVRQAPPITVEILRDLVHHTPADTAVGLRDRAALVLGFALMGRRSELSALDQEHLTFGPRGVEVFIPMSKTDQDAAGATVSVPYGSHPQTCPVRAVQAWLGELHARGLTGGPLLRPVDRFGRIAGTPGWAGRGGPRLSGTTLNQIVKDAARRAGLADAERYSAHSLRAGGATTLAEAGVPAARIALQGRWRPTSPTVHGYIRAVDRWRDNPMGRAGL
ncbi:site-specific integrase [Streptosporangium sandarakinum]|uniref:Site-specific recombinase XerD n=1 Tax=Streptosporangium sandarakinum TaxID=1260955 RepID=A0A852V3T5_9ACTN|nr:site-specific integrase [Streptosporangium sandarakinum]NYF44487.1 site-specific recombinase XerD [Streptosporangium sandarakinum]